MHRSVFFFYVSSDVWISGNCHVSLTVNTGFRPRSPSGSTMHVWVLLLTVWRYFKMFLFTRGLYHTDGGRGGFSRLSLESSSLLFLVILVLDGR